MVLVSQNAQFLLYLVLSAPTSEAGITKRTIPFLFGIKHPH